jgi:hypothetical protein
MGRLRNDSTVSKYRLKNLQSPAQWQGHLRHPIVWSKMQTGNKKWTADHSLQV